MDWKVAKQKYESIHVPKELSERVQSVLDSKKKIKIMRINTKKIVAVAAVFLAFFIIGLNTNQVFAASMEEIPFLRNLVRVFTFKQYEDESDTRILNVTIPELKNTGYDDLENRINHEIRKKMDTLIADGEKNALEYQEAYLSTGGNSEEMFQMELTVDYEILCSNEEYVSFKVWKSESLASVYYEEFYYNIDLETGKELTLRDLLGPDYKKIANVSVKEGIQKRKEEDQNASFFEEQDGAGISGFEEISDFQSFYINEDNNVVIVFEKYAIAPGYMGVLEFVVD